MPFMFKTRKYLIYHESIIKVLISRSPYYLKSLSNCKNACRRYCSDQNHLFPFTHSFQYSPAAKCHEMDKTSIFYPGNNLKNLIINITTYLYVTTCGESINNKSQFSNSLNMTDCTLSQLSVIIVVIFQLKSVWEFSFFLV